jgi:hypothetical protein
VVWYVWLLQIVIYVHDFLAQCEVYVGKEFVCVYNYIDEQKKHN